MDMEPSITRRQAIKAGAAMGLGLAVAGLLPSNLFAADGGTSSIFTVTDPALGAAKVSVEDMTLFLNRAVTALVGADSPQAAWSQLFSPDDVVGIKINAVGGMGVSTHKSLVAAMAAGLESAGVKTNNILVWDMMDMQLMTAGFKPNKSDKGVRFVDLKWSGVEDNPRDIAGAEAKLTKILTEQVSAVINAPILKDHGLCGVTFAMKNHFGSVAKPDNLHGTNCDPYLAVLNNQPEIRDKTRLIVGDATRAQYHSGPGYNPDYVWRPGILLVGTDPVAMDRIGGMLIDAKRAEAGMKSLKDTGREPTFIESAAKLGLGVSDPARIKIVEA